MANANREGITLEQWTWLVQWVKRIEPGYSSAEAEVFLDQFNYARTTRFNDYQLMLQGIEENHVSPALVNPGLENNGHHTSDSWTIVEASVVERQDQPAKKVKTDVPVSSQPPFSAEPPKADTVPVTATPANPNRMGIPPKKWVSLITRVQNIQSGYSHAQAEAFLDLFNFPENTRINDYEQLLRNIQENGLSIVRLEQQQRERNRASARISVPTPVYYMGGENLADATNTGDAIGAAVNSFKESEEYPQFLAQYHQAIDKIIAFYMVNVDDQAGKTLVSHNFEEFKKKISDSDHQNSHRYYQMKSVIEEIARLLALPNTKENPLSHKLAEIYELADRIAHCADGAISDILRASANLFAPGADLLSSMHKTREKIAHSTLREFMVYKRIGNNVHTFNAFLDRFNEQLGMPASQDRYRNLDAVTQTRVESCQRKLINALTPYRITYELANAHLSFLLSKLGADALANYDKIDELRLSLDIEDPEEGFKPGYKNLDTSALFIENNGGYQLRQDPLLLQIEMAKKLSRARSSTIWPSWSIETVDNGLGKTFQRIGDLFWQEIEGEVILPTIKSIGNRINQIAPEQLIRMIEQANAGDAALFDINPQRLHAATGQQIALFFAKLGDVRGLNYVIAHNNWFKNLDTNPLVPIILQFPPTASANLPTYLLHHMSPSELTQFLEKLGVQGSIDYVIKNFSWFRQLESNPLVPALLTLPRDRLVTISSELFHHLTTEQATQFFTKLGVEYGVAYATKNFDWFQQLNSNPLVPALLTLPTHQFTQVSTELFHHMTCQQATQVFYKWGFNASVNYIRDHLEWFQQLESNPFVPLLLKSTHKELITFPPILWQLMTVTTLYDFFKQRNDPGAAAYIDYYINGWPHHNNQGTDSKAHPIQDINLNALLLNIVFIKVHTIHNNVTTYPIHYLSRLFILASEAEDRQTIELLLQQSELDLKQSQYGHVENPLFVAIRKDLTWLVLMLLAKHPLSDYQDAGRHNVLFYAIQNKNLQILTALLDTGADANEKNLLTNTTALEQAVLSEDPRLVSKLLEHHAKDDSANALMLAIKQGNITMVEALSAATIEHYYHHIKQQTSVYDRAWSLAHEQPSSADIIKILEQNKAHLAKMLPALTLSDLFRYGVMSTTGLQSPISGTEVNPLSLPLYASIQATLAKLHETTGSEQIETAFILLNQVNFSLNRPFGNISSNMVSVISRLQTQIDHILFANLAPDSMKENLLALTEIQPALAADVYQALLQKTPATRLFFMNFIFNRMAEDLYFDVPIKFRKTNPFSLSTQKFLGN